MSSNGLGATGATNGLGGGIDAARDAPGQRPDRASARVSGGSGPQGCPVGPKAGAKPEPKPLDRAGDAGPLAPSVAAMIDRTAEAVAAAPSGGAAREIALLQTLVSVLREIVEALSDDAPISRPLGILGAHFGQRCGQPDAFGAMNARIAAEGEGIKRACDEIAAIYERGGPGDDHAALARAMKKCQEAGPEALGTRDFLEINQGSAELMRRFGCPAAAGAGLQADFPNA